MLALMEGMASVFDGTPIEAEPLDLGAVVPSAPVPEAFQPAPFQQAINDFAKRIPRLRAEIDPMFRRANALAAAVTDLEATAAVSDLAEQSTAIREAIARSFWVSDVDRETIINLKALVSDVLTGNVEVDEEAKLVGLPLPEFINEAKLAGAANLTDARLEVVLRNNVASALAAGQTTALRRPEVRPLVPLVMLANPEDSRSRPAHAQMAGYVGTIEDFRARGIVAPNGHNCRCKVRGVSIGEARQLGLVNDDGVPDAQAIRAHNGDRERLIETGQYPDPGFAVALVA